jgi:hypothetical protein
VASGLCETSDATGLELAVCSCSVCPRDADEEQPAPKSRFSDISRPKRETAEAHGGVQHEISIGRDRAEKKSLRGDTVLIADCSRAVVRRTILTAHALNFLLSPYGFIGFPDTSPMVAAPSRDPSRPLSPRTSLSSAGQAGRPSSAPQVCPCWRERESLQFF